MNALFFMVNDEKDANNAGMKQGQKLEGHTNLLARQRQEVRTETSSRKRCFISALQQQTWREA